MKKFKLSAMLLFAAMLMFSACGGGGGGSDDPGDSDNPGDNPGDDPNYTIEIKPDNATLYLNCEYEFYAKKENDSKHLDNITWEIDEASVAKINTDGKLIPLKAGKFKVTGTTEEGEIGIAECTVTATAVSDVFNYSAGIVTKYKGSDKNVTIPASINGTVINSINYYAFIHCISLESIEIPSGVTSIGNEAFSGCISLKSIEIPSGVTSIGKEAFSSCSSLERIEISSGVQSIGESAFQGCSSLKSIEIPPSVTSIGRGAFGGCSSLERIEIPSGVKIIRDCAFNACSSLKSIEIPSGVTSIEFSAFSYCSSLERIEIPSGVTSIGDQAFYGCSSLESIKIPTSVTEIGFEAFFGCTNMSSIKVDSLNDNYKDIDGVLCNKTGDKLLYVPDKRIENDTFYVNSKVNNINTWAFCDCRSLKSIKVDSLNAKYKDIDGVLYDKTGNYLWCFPNNKIVNGTFIIPSEVTEIINYAFYGCSSLKSIEIPSGVTSIYGKAFCYCSNLETVKVEAVNCPSIFIDPFGGCSKLTKIEVPSASLSKYKNDQDWDQYASIIVGF